MKPSEKQVLSAAFSNVDFQFSRHVPASVSLNLLTPSGFFTYRQV